MLIIECPHCHRTIVPLGDGECPACHLNTTDKSSANPDATLLYVMEATRFPGVCCTCNSATEHFARITRSGQVATSRNRGNSTDGLWIARFASLALFGLIGIILIPFVGLGEKSVGQASLTLRVPQCKRCLSTNPIDPDVVDLVHHQLGIIVHRKFAEQVKELNRHYR